MLAAPPRPSNKLMKLNRTAGLTYKSNLSLANPWRTKKADPNSYYRVLKLDPNVPWLMWQVKEAYRRAVRNAHPDGTTEYGENESVVTLTSGSRYTQPVSLFELVIVAGQTLLDPQRRRFYDDLPAGDPLFDKFWEENVIREWFAVPNRGAPMATIKQNIRELKKEQERKSTVCVTVVQEFDDYFYYWEEGCDVPERDVRLKWFSLLSSALWQRGSIENVRLGFTRSSHRVERRPWGTIYFVPVDIDPHPLIAMWLVAESFSIL